MTVTHDPENGVRGDCFRCCIASLLELPAQAVPHVMDYDWTVSEPGPGQWFKTLNDWLQQFDLTYLEFEFKPEQQWNWKAFDTSFNCYHTLSGQSPRAPHTVVAHNGEMVHDPHPNRAGLIGPNTDTGLYNYGFIIAQCKRVSKLTLLAVQREWTGPFPKITIV